MLKAVPTNEAFSVGMEMLTEVALQHQRSGHMRREAALSQAVHFLMLEVRARQPQAITKPLSASTTTTSPPQPSR